MMTLYDQILAWRRLGWWQCPLWAVLCAAILLATGYVIHNF